MKSLLQAAAWWADTVLSICYPEPERLPSLDDAARLAEREAEEEVAEPQRCGCCGGIGIWHGIDCEMAGFEPRRRSGRGYYSTATEAQEEVAEPASDCCFSEADWLGNNEDPLDRLIALVEDIRNLMSSAVFAAGVAESPGEVEPPASPGQPNLLPHERQAAASAIAQWISGDPCPPHNHDAWRGIARRIYNFADVQQ